MKSKPKKQEGFAMVLLVIIVGVVSFSSALLMNERALGEHNKSKSTLSSLAARYATEACVERALLTVRDDHDYEGAQNHTIGDIDCSAKITDNGGDTRVIQASTTEAGYTSNIFVTTQTLLPKIIATWIDTKKF